MVLAIAFAVSLQRSSRHQPLERFQWIRPHRSCVAVAIVGRSVCIQGGNPQYDLTELVTRRGARIRLMKHLGLFFVGGQTGLMYYSKGGHIYVVNRHDEVVRTFGSFGTKSNQFTKGGAVWWNYEKDGPQYLAVGRKGDIYAYDDGSRSIKHFDAKGKFLTSFPSDILKDQQLTGLAVDSSDDVYATYAGVKTPSAFVACFSPNGKLIRRFGSVGDGVGQFKRVVDNPWSTGACGLGIAPSGNVYVLDVAGMKIDVFDPLGRPLKSIVLHSRDNDFFMHAIAIDKRGTVFVATSNGVAVRRRH